MEFSFGYTAAQEEFAVEVRAWLDANLPTDLIHIRDPLKMSHEQWAMRRDFKRTLAEKGWLWATNETRYGGGGLDGAKAGVISRELGKRGIGPQPIQEWAGGAVAGIMVCATEEQKERFLPLIFSGTTTTWQLFTEPEAGTDVANQQIRAIRDGDDYIVNGQKIFVGGTHPPQPEMFYLLAKSDGDAPRHQNLSAFLCPADLPGVTIKPLDLFTPVPMPFAHGVTGANLEANKNTVFFDNVRVSASYMIGTEGDGWKVAMGTLTGEHGGVSELPTNRPAPKKAAAPPPAPDDDDPDNTGPRNHIAESFFDQCRNDPRINKRLKENPQLIGNLVDAYIYAQTERAFKLRDQGGMGGAYGGPQAMVYQKQQGTRFITDMAAVLGPYSLTDDDEVAYGAGIFEVAQRCGVCLAPAGTPEALKIVVSRALMIGR